MLEDIKLIARFVIIASIGIAGCFLLFKEALLLFKWAVG